MLFFSPQNIKHSASNIFLLCSVLGLFATLINACNVIKPAIGVMHTIGNHTVSGNYTALATFDKYLVSRLEGVSWLVVVRGTVGMDGPALLLVLSLVLLALDCYLSLFCSKILFCERPNPDLCSIPEDESPVEESATRSKTQKRNGRRRARARAEKAEARATSSHVEAEPVEVTDDQSDTSFTSKSSPPRVKRTDATKYHLKKRSQERSPITTPPQIPVKKSPRKSKKKSSKRSPPEDVKLSLPSTPNMEVLEGAPTGELVVRPYIRAPLSALPTWFPAYISPDVEWVVLTPPGYFWSTANRDFESYEEIFGPINIDYTSAKAWVPSASPASHTVGESDPSLRLPAMPEMESIEESSPEFNQEYEFVNHRIREDVYYMRFSPLIEDVIYDVQRDLWRRFYRFLSIEDEFPDWNWESITVEDIKQPVQSSSPPPSYQESARTEDADLKAKPVIVLAESLKSDLSKEPPVHSVSPDQDYNGYADVYILLAA